MKNIISIFSLLILLSSCQNIYYENKEKVVKLINVENNIAHFIVYDHTLTGSNEDFVERMNKILSYYNLEDCIFTKEWADIDEIVKSRYMMIINNVLIEEYGRPILKTDEAQNVKALYNKYTTSSYLTKEDIVKACEINKKSFPTQNIIYFYDSNSSIREYANVIMRKDGSYDIALYLYNETYLAKPTNNGWKFEIIR